MSYVYAASFVDADTGTAVGHAGQIARTTDGGRTWRDQVGPTSWNLYGVIFVDADHEIATGWGGTILGTATGGE